MVAPILGELRKRFVCPVAPLTVQRVHTAWVAKLFIKSHAEVDSGKGRRDNDCHIPASIERKPRSAAKLRPRPRAGADLSAWAPMLDPETRQCATCGHSQLEVVSIEGFRRPVRVSVPKTLPPLLFWFERLRTGLLNYSGSVGSLNSTVNLMLPWPNCGK